MVLFLRLKVTCQTVHLWIQPSGKYIVSSDDVIGALAGGGAVHLNSSLSIKFNDRSENNAFKGTLTGAGDLVKISGNVVTLRGGFEGDDGHTGRTRVEEGTLRVKGFLSDKTPVSVAENATYQVRSTDTIGSIEGAGSIELDEGFTLTAGGLNTDTTYSGQMTGAGAFNKVGTGATTFWPNTYIGNSN